MPHELARVTDEFQRVTHDIKRVKLRIIRVTDAFAQATEAIALTISVIYNVKCLIKRVTDAVHRLPLGFFKEAEASAARAPRAEVAQEASNQSYYLNTW